MAETHTPALVVKLESGDTVVERASNWCSSTLNAAHMLLHAGGDGTDWKITIERRELTSEQYDAMRQKFENDALGEIMALDMSKHLETAALEEQLAKPAAEKSEGSGE